MGVQDGPEYALSRAEAQAHQAYARFEQCVGRHAGGFAPLVSTVGYRFADSVGDGGTQGAADLDGEAIATAGK